MDSELNCLMNIPRKFPRAPEEVPIRIPAEPVSMALQEALTAWAMSPLVVRPAFLEAVVEVLLREGLYYLNRGDIENALYWLRRYLDGRFIGYF